MARVFYGARGVFRTCVQAPIGVSAAVATLYCTAVALTSGGNAAHVDARDTTKRAADPSSPLAGRPTFTPCHEVSCKSKEELAAMFEARDRPPRHPKAHRAAGDVSGLAAAAAAGGNAAGIAAAVAGVPSTSATRQASLPRACPVTREELGRHTWALLHSIAAYYPDEPTAADRDAAENLIRALAQLYPCGDCRARFVIDVAANPPRLTTREDFAIWLCEQHNTVNALTQAPAFPCTMSSLQTRWRTGDASCWAIDDVTAEESL